VRNKLQSFRMHLNASAIQIGNVGNFGERRNEINLGDLAALQEQLAEMNAFPALFEEYLVEIGRGEMASFAEYFP